MEDTVIIEKIKIRMVYIFCFIAMITFFISFFFQSETIKIILLLIGTAIFILSVVSNYKYIRCNNCGSVIWVRGLIFKGEPNFCKDCGFKILYK